MTTTATAKSTIVRLPSTFTALWLEAAEGTGYNSLDTGRQDTVKVLKVGRSLTTIAAGQDALQHLSDAALRAIGQQDMPEASRNSAESVVKRLAQIGVLPGWRRN